MSDRSNVLVVGAWHLGSVIAACLCEAGHKVSLYDQTAIARKKWSEGVAPIHEPGLDDLVKKHWRTNLFWNDKMGSASRSADWIVLSYDTPINDQDEIVIDAVEEGLNDVMRAGVGDDTNFFFTSQLPVGTSRRFREQILKSNPRWHGHVTYQPENLRLGQAIVCFQNPDRMVLGIDVDDKEHAIVKRFQSLLGNFKTPINVMSLESAEMVKHALNSFLATCVVFANEVSSVCESTGANAWDVMASLKQDSRVGPKAFLSPGLGFAGGTLARDVKTLSKLSEGKGALNFFSDLYDINNARNKWVVQALQKHHKELFGKKIVLLGVTYKPFTSTVRRSPALEIAALLKNAGAQCVAIDPMADMDELSSEEKQALPFELIKDTGVAFDKADAAVHITAWPEFKTLAWKDLKVQMKSPVIIDSQNQLVSVCTPLGFEVRVPGISRRLV